MPDTLQLSMFPAGEDSPLLTHWNLRADIQVFDPQPVAPVEYLPGLEVPRPELAGARPDLWQAYTPDETDARIKYAFELKHGYPPATITRYPVLTLAGPITKGN